MGKEGRPYPGQCARDGKRQGPYQVLSFDFSDSVESITFRSTIEKKELTMTESLHERIDTYEDITKRFSD